MAKKNKIPKKVAGFKIPKAIRKSPVVTGLLASDTGRKILGDALIAGATAAAGIIAARNHEVLEDAGDNAVKKTKKAGNLAKDLAKGVTGAMAEVIGDAARAVIPGVENDEKEKAAKADVPARAPVAPKTRARTPRVAKARPSHH
ncbi:hypothetical protein [Terrihabitans sp. B22-R8]|uniref:hypothetical protein n=1 Tax=Terrihabitans sp. B22-R8 TaxID=3425128 RepID=UPI00403C3502